MNIPELIRRKREGGALTAEELGFLVGGYLEGGVAEYQMSAFLMAVVFQGMTPDEAAALTRIMRDSGTQYDLSSISKCPVDKHSTGGVGDKVSLILAPLVAAAGVVDPMVSGRALGHTGGTLDKLDAIPGYRWCLSEKEFLAQLDRIGCAIIGQTQDFVPADRRIYALRDVTATVESLPLICASILSKKAASGAKGLVMDVKSGSGAFLTRMEESRELAGELIRIGEALGLRVVALITQMSQPLGTMVGNAMEVRESIEVLKGGGPADTRAVTVELGAEMAVMAGVAENVLVAHERLTKLLDDGTALGKFREWVEAQGGDPGIADDSNLLASAPDRRVWNASKAGTIQSMETRLIGVAANVLGAGRVTHADTIDHAVGLEIHAKTGEEVAAGQPILTIHHRGGKGVDECERLLAKAIVIDETPADPLPLILDRLPVSAG